jgi:hypothetical protein
MYLYELITKFATTFINLLYKLYYISLSISPLFYEILIFVDNFFCPTKLTIVSLVGQSKKVA